MSYVPGANLGSQGKREPLAADVNDRESEPQIADAYTEI